MKQRVLWIIWAVLYGICAGLGFVANPTDAQAVAMTILSMLFFVPGFLLLVDSLRTQDKKALSLVRLVSILSLSLTCAAFIANLASVTASDAAGNVLYAVLLLVSAPMASMGYELASLFLWACLLIASVVFRKKITN